MGVDRPKFTVSVGHCAAALALLGGVAVAGCAGEEADLPEGRPAEVVGRAPDRTMAAGAASVAAAAPTATAEGGVDFRTGRADLEFEPRGLAEPPLELRDPVAVLDLVRGAVRVESYGGSEVRGVSTLRYEVDIDPARAAAATPPDRRRPIASVAEVLDGGTMFADVYVDRFNRIRRVTIPLDYKETRPRGRERRVVEVVIVDFVSFPERSGS